MQRMLAENPGLRRMLAQGQRIAEDSAMDDAPPLPREAPDSAAAPGTKRARNGAPSSAIDTEMAAEQAGAAHSPAQRGLLPAQTSHPSEMYARRAAHMGAAAESAKARELRGAAPSAHSRDQLPARASTSRHKQHRHSAPSFGTCEAVERRSYDSDTSDSNEGRPAPAGQHDTLLYDPGADSDDERAVAYQRGGRASDALLSCPGCFTMLCTDCQQHARDESRFRAMFVQSCRLLDKGGGEGELCVLCEVCEAEVGTYDEAVELYEFHSVLASEA
jgi:E2F-associated phosphoprotein